MSEFGVWIAIAFGSILSAALFVLCTLPVIAILQQGGYSGKAFVRWYCRKGNMLPRRHNLLTLSLFLLTALFCLCFSFLGARYAGLVSAAPFCGTLALYVYASRHALKVPLKRTGRALRLLVAYFILTAGVCFGILVGLGYASEAIGKELVSLFRFVPLTLVPLILPFIAATANFIMKAYEVPRNRRYIARAKRKLAESKCVKVGITGSFAKTSVKHMAAQIAGTKFKVIATPASYNTPMGIAKTVFETGLACDVFFAEMGARRMGDISELCDMVSPDFGAVTGICPQHLETFLSLENIKSEKGVLAQRTKKCVLGSSASELPANDAFVYGKNFGAEEIICSADGTRFQLVLGGERIPVETVLLGKHAAEDIALAAALCHLLGMTKEEIAAGVKEVKPISHRLEKLNGNGGVVVLDDSYNSNVEGAKDAVETLKLFTGKKFVVTPGLVELGVIEREENEKLGASLVGLDGVILVGETQVLPVRNGYLAAGGEEAKLKIVKSPTAATEAIAAELSAGDCVLFLNDLPDIYN
ncbi:MAG: hypothetical protein K2L87_02860 [Clostridiales bacterium]|nr:hypothetical protein [Clostridiales bacterium]